MKLEWFIGRRYLSSRRGARFLSLITLISIGGVVVGVMALIIVTSVMNGLQTELRDKILGTNPDVWVTTYGETLRLERWPEVRDRLMEIPGVSAAAPFVHAEVGLRNAGGHGEFAILRGIDPSHPGEAVTDIVEQIRRGEHSLGETRSGYPPILVGASLADRFGLYPGDVVDVISLAGARMTAMGVVPPMRKFEVTGRFRTGMFEYDNKFMYTTLEAAQDLISLEGAVSGLEVATPDPDQADILARRIDARLGVPYRAVDWKRDNAALFAALRLEKLAMTIILLLIVIVAAFNIVSTLVMAVADKTREIGILKAMGMTRRRILNIFVLQGVVIGIVGSFLGTALGLLVTWVLDRYRLIRIPGDVYFVDYLPVRAAPLDVAMILIASVLISFLATIYPARQAAKLLPIEAIRHE